MIEPIGVYLGALGFLIAVFDVALKNGAFPRTKSFWKKVDYAWLLVAALGILSASQKAKEIQFRSKLQNAIDQRQFLATMIVREIDRKREQLRDDITSLEKLPRSDPEIKRNIQQAISDNREFIAWCDWTLDNLRKCQGTLRWVSEFRRVLTVDEGEKPEVHNFKLSFWTDLREFGEHEKTMDTCEGMLRLTPNEERWFQWTPALFVLALAIRWTKVTAELKGYDQPVPPPAA